jgi:hypothetical protein
MLMLAFSAGRPSWVDLSHRFYSAAISRTGSECGLAA